MPIENHLSSYRQQADRLVTLAHAAQRKAQQAFSTDLDQDACELARQGAKRARDDAGNFIWEHWYEFSAAIQERDRLKTQVDVLKKKEEVFLQKHAVIDELLAERLRQDEKWGEQNYIDGTGGEDARRISDQLRQLCKDATETTEGDTWTKILGEEVGEAFAETDVAALRAELIQVGAVAVQWIEAIDRRDSQGTRTYG